MSTPTYPGGDTPPRGERMAPGSPAARIGELSRQVMRYLSQVSRSIAAFGRQLPRRRLPRRRLVLGSLAAIGLVVSLILGVVGFQAIHNTRMALDTAATLCSDLESHNYAQAYGLLSASIRHAIPVQNFVSLAKVADMTYGLVRDCGHVSNVSIQKNQATLQMQITRTMQTSGKLLLVKESGAWQIDAVAGPLQVVG
jgi:hypothetical protein